MNKPKYSNVHYWGKKKTWFLFQFLFYRDDQLLSLTHLSQSKSKRNLEITPLHLERKLIIPDVNSFRFQFNSKSIHCEVKISTSVAAKAGQDKGGLCWENNGLSEPAVTQRLWNVIVKTPLLTSESV